MTTLYPGPAARITHEVFHCGPPCNQAYPIRDLRRIHTVQARPLITAATGAPARVCSTGLAGAVMAFAILDTPALTGPNAGTVLVAMILTSGLAALTWLLRRRPLELRAVYRGQVVCLLRTRDRLLFGKVIRALRRALEYQARSYGGNVR